MHARAFSLTVLLVSALLGAAHEATAAAGSAVVDDIAQAAAVPADPWPRKVDLSNASVLIYQPQVNRWDGNRIDMRAAVAIQPVGAKEETFGVFFATARTQVDKVTRTVVFDDIAVYQSDFPMLPDHGAQYAAEFAKQIAGDVRTISLDRLEAAVAVVGVKAPPVEVNNAPPQIIVSQQSAILVPIDGAPILKPVPDHDSVERVLNTRALLVRLRDVYYLHVYDGWMSASNPTGPWTMASPGPLVKRQLDETEEALSKQGVVDLLDGGPKANPKPSLARGAPAIYTAQGPAELIVFDGQPNFVPVTGTQLLWATNTHSDVLIETTTSSYYVLLAGRWFRAGALTGPWTYVAHNALPRDFAQIPDQSPAAVVLASVAGTRQAQEAMIANTVPQSASVPRRGGPTFTPSFDGAPQYRPIDGTLLTYVVNSEVPIIRVEPTSFFVASGGVWFSAPAVTGPWTVATAVPPAIYAIPASSPLHYVTYVRIYEVTPETVYVGYTPGYLGTVVAPTGVVVYGTGYSYPAWVGTTWYPAPVTYTVAAAPVYNPAVGFTFGFAMGLATAAWTSPYYGGAYYHPAYWGGYPCCAAASANIYGQWGSAVYSGTRSWYAGGGVAGTTASGAYTNARTGASGSYEAGRQYNAYTGNATRGYDRTVNTPEGGSANVERAQNTNVYTGQRSTGSAVSGTTSSGSAYERSGATSAGPEGEAHAGSGSTYNAKTGQTNTWSSASAGNNHYADVNGNVYKNTGSGWEQSNKSASPSSASSQASAQAEREAQARSAGEQRYNSYKGSGAGERSPEGGEHFGGGGGGGASSGGRFGGGGGGRGRR